MWNWKWNNFQPTPLGKAFFLVSDWQKCKLKFTHFPPLFAPCSPVPLNDNVASPSASTTPPILCYCCWCCCCFPVNMHSRRSKSKKNCMYGKFAEHVNFFLAFETGLAWNDFSLCCRVFCCWLFIFVKFFLDFCLAAAACKNIYWHVCASFATAVLVVCCFHCFASCSFLEFQLLFRENGVTRAVRVAPS